MQCLHSISCKINSASSIGVIEEVVIVEKSNLKTYAGHNIIFSDKNGLHWYSNKQNDCIYGVCLLDIPAVKITVKRYQNASPELVWARNSDKRKVAIVID